MHNIVYLVSNAQNNTFNNIVASNILKYFAASHLYAYMRSDQFPEHTLNHVHITWQIALMLPSTFGNGHTRNLVSMLI